MFLGIDLGTSGVKTLIIDEQQSIVATATAELTVQRPHDGWSEQTAADWITATEECLGKLKSDHAQILGAVTGIGLSGQMHGATLLDASDNVLRPCILWNDTRSASQAKELDTDGSRKLSGNIMFPGFTAPKLLWVRDNEPQIFSRTSKVLLPKDYLRLWLCGETVSEMSDAAGTGWLDVGERQWSTELLDAGAMTAEQMPDLVEGCEVSGTLRAELAARFGMGKSVVVAGGAGDNAASACGMGTVAPGNAFLSLGTSGVLFASTEAYRPAAASAVHTFCHALPSTWHQMGVILSATDSLNWYAGITGRAPAELTNAVEDGTGGELQQPSETLFLPYLGGERTPHNDAVIRGSFIGLSHNSDQNSLTHSVLEGVGYAFRENLDALASAGTRLERVTAIGGGSRSEYWLKMLASILGLPVDTCVDGDFGAGFGAARLGMIAATGADPHNICSAPSVNQSFEPDQRLTSDYEQAYTRYRAHYAPLRELQQTAQS